MPLVAIRNLTHRYGEQAVLDLPAWEFDAGQHQLVLGPSGSGKSTLLSLLSGLMTPQAGEIHLDGQRVDQLGAAARDTLRGQRIGLVLQRLHLIPAISVRANLRLAQTLAGLQSDDARIDSVLDSLGVRDKADRKPSQLSVGEAQRVALARAVLNKPALILADEPTSALDDDNCAAAIDLLLRQSNENGATLVIATHDSRVKDRFANTLQLKKVSA